jgi:hypothetical protein
LSGIIVILLSSHTRLVSTDQIFVNDCRRRLSATVEDLCLKSDSTRESERTDKSKSRK